MQMVRMLSALIAAALIADFAVASWMSLSPAVALLPAGVGAAAMLTRCWHDAASSRERRTLARLAMLLTVGTALSFLVFAVGPKTTQTPLLAALLLGSLFVSARAIAGARRRRLRGMSNYYLA